MNINKVLILNEGYSDNLGDQAIKDSMVYLLECHGIKNIFFQDFTKNINRPRSIVTGNGTEKKQSTLSHIKNIIPPKLKWLIKNIMRVIRSSNDKYDLVIIGGGQLILSNATFSIAMFLWVFALNLLGNKNIILFAVGSGDEFNYFDKLLYGYSLKKVNRIYVRDEKSKRTLKDTFNIDADFVYDVAFIHSQIINSKSNTGEGGVLLGVISYGVYARYKTKSISKEYFFETWVKLLKDNGINIEYVKLFYTTQDDRLASIEFKHYIYNKYNTDLELIETNTKEKLINLLNKSELVVSARMHALILGVVYKCNIITYPISNKLIEFDLMICKIFDLDTIQGNIKKNFLQVLNEK